MKLYNRGKRAFIINRDDARSGCRLPKDLIGRDKAYIDPGTTVEVADACGRKLVELYSAELMNTGGESNVATEKATIERKKRRERRAKREVVVEKKVKKVSRKRR